MSQLQNIQMSLKGISLKSLFDKVLKGSISHSELAHLIHFCRSISESYLLHRRTSLYQICSLNGFTVSDLAMDCIAELFARDEAGDFYQFKNFANSLNSKLDEIREIELQLAFKQFALKVTISQLAKIYQQADPMGAKIHRNIKEWTKKISDIKLVEDFRGYVIQPADRDPLDHLPQYPTPQLQNELLKVSTSKATTPDLLNCLITILNQQQDYRRSVPLFEVVQIFKRFYLNFTELEMVEEGDFSIEEIARIDLENIKRQTQFTVQEKIFSTYLVTGKINKNEARALSEILMAIIDDWCMDNPDRLSLYQYAQEHLNISETEYERDWRSKVEYLYKLAREKFSAAVMGNI